MNDGTPGPKGNKPKEETKTDLEASSIPKPSLIGEIEFDDDNENKEGGQEGENKEAGEEEKKAEEAAPETAKNEQGSDNEEDDVALI